ncbi:hypothetical protein D9M69_326720 [compost metagenome]
MGAATNVLHDAVHFLRTVAHADGEHQERHQDGVGVQVVAKQRQHPQQPAHRHHGTEQHDQGTAHAAGVVVDQHSGYEDCDGKEHQHLAEAIDQVANHLGEADYMDTCRIVLVLAANLLELAAERAIVEGFAGFSIDVEQWHQQHARLEIRCHDAADFAGTLDVQAQASQRFG